MARTKNVSTPEVGSEVPEFYLPGAHGGQLRLKMRSVRGPVVVAFYRGPWSEEDVEYFGALASKEDEINHASGSVVGIGAVEPDEAREFARASGLKSYVLYDFTRDLVKQWGLLEKDKERGDHARPAVFLVDGEHKVVEAWTDGRPDPTELLAKVSEITGLPKAPEEEKPEKEEAADGAEKPKKMSAEEREKIKAERRAAREAGKSVKTAGDAEKPAEAGGAEKPKKMSAEERERIKAERRAAREAGKSVKSAGSSTEQPAAEAADKPKKMSAEERERIKAERRAAREAGKSLKKPVAGAPEAAEQPAEPEKTAEAEPAPEPAAKPKKMSAEERERVKAERRAAREAGQSLKKPTTGDAGEGEEKP